MCLIVGVLFGAIVLENTDAFTFYTAMSAVCLLAALFFLFLRPIERDEQSLVLVKPTQQSVNRQGDLKRDAEDLGQKREGVERQTSVK